MAKINMPDIDVDGLKVTGLPTPTAATQAANKAYVDTKQDKLNYTPVNKAGDVMGRLEVTGSGSNSPGITITGQRANLLFNTIGVTGGAAFRVVQADISNDQATTTVGSIGAYGSGGGDIPVGHYMYLDSRPDGTWNNATLKIDSNDRVGIAIASSSRPSQALDVNGKIRMRTKTLATDGDDIVTTKSYVDDKVKKDVPANAVFTDTVTPIVDNLNSTLATSALSAKQGKVLSDLIGDIGTALDLINGEVI